MIPDEEDITFEDDDEDAGDPIFPDPEDDPGITNENSMTSTTPEGGDQVPDNAENIPAKSGVSGAFIAMPGGKRVRAT